MMNDKSHAATPATATISEPKLELSAGVPSSLAETVGERLKRIYPEHYVHILSEANRVNGAEHTARILQYHAINYSCVLSVMFVWERSQQGCDFWADLAQREDT